MAFYTQDDYNLSFSAENVSERKKLNIAEIKKRVSDMGASGLADHLVEKIVVVWGKGDYNYEKYLRLVSSYNKSYTYLLGDKNLAVNYVLQFSKIAVLLLSLISVIKLFKRKEHVDYVYNTVWLIFILSSLGDCTKIRFTFYRGLLYL